ncbi:MAG: hypothetical protein ACJ72Z_09245 [Pyrinomonadaceae bacterium]
MKIIKMGTIRTDLLVIGVFFIVLTLLQSSAFAQAGSGAKTTSVVVANSGANPVPVQVVPKRTVELLRANGVEIPAYGKREWQIDVRGYSRIKMCSYGPNFAVAITDNSIPDVLDFSSFDGILLGFTTVRSTSQEELCRVIDFLPESGIYLTATGGSEPARGSVRVWAQ